MFIYLCIICISLIIHFDILVLKYKQKLFVPVFPFVCLWAYPSSVTLIYNVYLAIYLIVHLDILVFLIFNLCSCFLLHVISFFKQTQPV